MTGPLPAGADIFVPDGAGCREALARVTDLGVMAHPDDLELLAIGAIGECIGDPTRWFGGVVCTDGAGGVTDPAEVRSTEDLAAARRVEQREAADLGGYSIMVQLGHSSAWVRDPTGNRGLIDEIAWLVDQTHPTNLYTHNLLDKHETHVAVSAAVVTAVRHLDLTARPSRMVGVESWRDLDWLPDHEKVRIDVSAHADLAESLISVHRSQLGPKRYDLAAAGRRVANATIFEPRQADEAHQVIVAMDLTPLARNDQMDPLQFACSAIDRFRAEAEQTLSRWFDGGRD